MPSPRRFPSPWHVVELEVCFIVTDNAGQKLAYVYFEEEPGRHVTRPSRPDNRRLRPQQNHSREAQQ
jgi:hypothetical protein